ncbi:hypothetical protein LLEC1_01693 [Akanthomyces lecanii]|uniref:Uncharacterized protein n=1 Tax=Cordyceps confragosa TaxID=2714763 RepID=A0A179I1T3_CORDF|nr:hypothetical protein LLEC1_01693 [Akanthomyces lecanii]
MFSAKNAERNARRAASASRWELVGLAVAGARAVYATDLTTEHITSLRHEGKRSGLSYEIQEHALDVTNEAKTTKVLKKIIADDGASTFTLPMLVLSCTEYKCGLQLTAVLPVPLARETWTFSPDADTSYNDDMVNIMQR